MDGVLFKIGNKKMLKNGINKGKNLYKNSNLSLVNKIIFINFLIESLILITEDRFLIIAFQTIINIFLILLYHLNISKIYNIKYLSFLTYFLILYNTILIIFSSDLILSFNYSSKFLLPIFYLIIGITIINNLLDIQQIIKTLWIYLAYFTIYIIIVNIFAIGEEMYVGGLKTGYFSLNGLYIPCFSLIVLLFNYNYIKDKKTKYLTLIFGIATLLIFVVLLKRTMLLLLGISLIIYLIKYAKLSRIIPYIIVVFIIFSSIPFFQENLTKSLESRNSRFNKEYSVTGEGRFTENIIMYNIMIKEPIKIILGSGEVFNDRKYISKYYELEREAHNSYIRIFWNGGIVGIILFILFYFFQVNILLLSYRKIKDIALKKLMFFIIFLILLRFINDFSSGITYVSFNAFCYLLIGGVIKLSIINFNKLNLKKQP